MSTINLKGATSGTIALVPTAIAGSNTLTLPAATGTVATTADIPVVATQANQETATSTTTFVSPGRQQYHASAAKAWAYSTSGGTVSGSYNITSVTDGAAGVLTFNFTVAMSSANYVASNTGDGNLPGAINSRATTTCEVRNYNTLTQGLQDSNVHFIAFGDQ